VVAAMETANVLGHTLVNFSRDARFPEDDDTSKLYVDGEALPVALKAVATARSELEVRVIGNVIQQSAILPANSADVSLERNSQNKSRERSRSRHMDQAR
jgi:hypothetical protein